MNKTFYYATILAVATAIISGISSFVNKFAVSTFSNPVLFTTVKNSLVALFFLGIFLAIRRWTELKKLNRKQWIKLSLIGAIGGSLPFALFFTGLSQTSAINGSLIHKTLFIFVALFAIPFLKEKLVWQQWLGVAIIFGSNLLIGGFSGFSFNLGELMILGATILWAIENIIAKKALADISSLTVASARMIFGSVLLSIYILLTGGFGQVTSIGNTQWLWILLTSIFLLGYVLTWYSALKYAPASYVATILTTSTIVTNILSAVFITHAFTIKDLTVVIIYGIGIALMISFAQKTNVSLSNDFSAGTPTHPSPYKS